MSDYYYFLNYLVLPCFSSVFIPVKLGNSESCVSHFERALTLAKLQEDDSAMTAIQKVSSLLLYSYLCHLFSSIKRHFGSLTSIILLSGP